MKKYVIFDLDNCLSDDRNRIPLIDWNAKTPSEKYAAYHARCGEDAPGNTRVYESWINKADHTPIFLTARPTSVRENTESWVDNELDGDALGRGLLLMRENADQRPSVEVKRSQLRLLSKVYNVNPESIAHAYDDRPEIVEMYKSEGIQATVLSIHDHCAYTNPTKAAATEQELLDLSELTRAKPQPKPNPDLNPKVTAADVLGEMAKTFRERQSVYKDNYKMVAKLMAVLFPQGVPSELVVQDQFHLFELVLVKLSRYAISGLTHIDSVHDLSVYGAMCEAINLNNQKESK